jgi:hypothetical protein
VRRPVLDGVNVKPDRAGSAATETHSIMCPSHSRSMDSRTLVSSVGASMHTAFSKRGSGARGRKSVLGPCLEARPGFCWARIALKLSPLLGAHCYESVPVDFYISSCARVGPAPESPPWASHSGEESLELGACVRINEAIPSPYTLTVRCGGSSRISRVSHAWLELRERVGAVRRGPV